MNMWYTDSDGNEPGGGGGYTLALYGFQLFHLGPQQRSYCSCRYSSQTKMFENIFI